MACDFIITSSYSDHAHTKIFLLLSVTGIHRAVQSTTPSGDIKQTPQRLNPEVCTPK